MVVKIVAEEIVYQGKIFDLVKSHFRLENGQEHTFDLIKHQGAVVIIPIDRQGNVLFVRQFRIGAEEELLELPAGLLETGETPQESAQREIQEECGMASTRIEYLGEFFMSPGYSTEKMRVFLATDLYDSRLPADQDEFLTLVAIPVHEVYHMASSGELVEGKTITALFMAAPTNFPGQWNAKA